MGAGRAEVLPALIGVRRKVSLLMRGVCGRSVFWNLPVPRSRLSLQTTCRCFRFLRRLFTIGVGDLLHWLSRSRAVHAGHIVLPPFALYWYAGRIDRWLGRMHGVERRGRSIVQFVACCEEKKRSEENERFRGRLLSSCREGVPWRARAQAQPLLLDIDMLFWLVRFTRSSTRTKRKSNTPNNR